ncbi:MAG: TonB-dependent receptor [Alphaproteobacteria bacterium]|nr:TonB-dependent receptor [Alphaproteobacteria bacterium]
MRPPPTSLTLCALLVVVWASISPAAATSDNPITAMSLEYLMNVEVTTVSKHPEQLRDAAAAVYVLSREEIQRSGVSTIPEALRLVPGVNVARINANTWAISVRGFNGRFANKLLVMIDGRSVYTSLFSGVFWDRVNLPLDDIERIEVVRGPGGTLWGANAVNGVINIITRHSSDTQGRRAEVSTGNEDLGILSLRQGGVIGGDMSYRLSTKVDRRAGSSTEDGTDGNDTWSNGRVDYRLDWAPSARDTVLFEAGFDATDGGDVSTAPLLVSPYSETRDGDTERSGVFLQGRWDRRLSETTDFSLQSFLDHRQMSVDSLSIEESRTTLDVQGQHNFVVGSFADLSWGGGYRLISDDLQTDSFAYQLDPMSETVSIVNAFAQASRRFFDDRVEFTLGSKVEHHSISGTELQPSARVAWTPTPQHTLWGAVSHAIRTPSRGENDADIINVVIPPNTVSSLPLAPQVKGSRDLHAESLTAYEIGYRTQALPTLSFDVAGFYNDYDGLLLSTTTGTPVVQTFNGVPYLVVPLAITGTTGAWTYGTEIAATWQPISDWRLRGSYSFIQEHIQGSGSASWNTPRHQFSIHSMATVAPEVYFDTVLRFVDEVPTVDADGYVELDARIAWRPRETVELALTGRNLLHNGHREFGIDRAEIPNVHATEVARSVRASLSIQF